MIVSAMVIPALVLALGMTPASAFDYQSYTPGSLFTVGKSMCPSEQHADEPKMLGKDSFDLFVHQGLRKLKASVVYSGSFRAMDEKGVPTVMTRQWLAQMGQVQQYGLYRHELQVREGNRRFWIPVQEPLIASMRAEAKPGSRMILYAVYTGCSTQGTGRRNPAYHFIISEFEAK